MQSFTPESRRSHENKLLSEYHSALTDRGVQDYSHEQFLNDVRIAVLPRFVLRTNVFAGVYRRTVTDEGRARAIAMVDRMAMLVDWNCEEVIPR